MIIIIGKDDLSLQDFPFDFYEKTKMHCKIVAVQEIEETSQFHITRSIYQDVDKRTVSKQELINYIEKAL